MATHPKAAPTTTYPGEFALFKPSTAAMKKAAGGIFLTILILFLIGIGLGIVFSVLRADEQTQNLVGQIGNWAGNLFTVPMFAFIILSAVRGTKVTSKEAFNYAKSNLGRFFLANLIVGAIAGGIFLVIFIIGLIAGISAAAVNTESINTMFNSGQRTAAFIVALFSIVFTALLPAYYITLRLSMANYLLIDNPKMTGWEAVKGSWNLTKNQLGKFLGIIGVSLLLCLPIITIIGIIATFVLLYFYAAATPLLYTYLTNTARAELPPPAKV